jgi:hypothetical protein
MRVVNFTVHIYTTNEGTYVCVIEVSEDMQFVQSNGALMKREESHTMCYFSVCVYTNRLLSNQSIGTVYHQG